MKSELFESIKVNVETGEVEFPSPEGFNLDMEKVYSTAQMFLPFCHGDLEMAVRQAIHGQLASFLGAKSLMR